LSENRSYRSMSDVAVRQARPDDAEAVAAFASDTWDRFDGGDYIPDVFPEWVAGDGDDQRTVVAELDGAVVGVCQCVALSAHETWSQGLRVAPAHRGSGVASALNGACFDWARERSATVCRAMVFSWNRAGLGTARGVGFAPATEFRWAHPEPDPNAAVGSDAADDSLDVVGDPDAAWSAWRRSDARAHLSGLGLDPEESWALSEVTRERFHSAADESSVLAVCGPAGTRAATYRSRVFERESGDDSECDDGSETEATDAESAASDGTDPATDRWAEYGLAAWTDLPAARALFAAVARDAADCDADRVRVLIPETARHVSDVAYAGTAVSDDPDFVLEADLTGRGPVSESG
jgi:GNAT superfamily N-acetyltransferase